MAPPFPVVATLVTVAGVAVAGRLLRGSGSRAVDLDALLAQIEGGAVAVDTAQAQVESALAATADLPYDAKARGDANQAAFKLLQKLIEEDAAAHPEDKDTPMRVVWRVMDGLKAAGHWRLKDDLIGWRMSVYDKAAQRAYKRLEQRGRRGGEKAARARYGAAYDAAKAELADARKARAQSVKREKAYEATHEFRMMGGIGKLGMGRRTAEGRIGAATKLIAAMEAGTHPLGARNRQARERGQEVVRTATAVYDPMEGLAATSDNRNVDYAGFIVWMLPRRFLSLNPEVEGPSRLKLVPVLEQGLPIAPPSLYVDLIGDDADRPLTFRVVSHEGRHRMHAVLERSRQLGVSEPVPVHVFVRMGYRARDFTPEMLLGAKLLSDRRAPSKITYPISDFTLRGERVTA